MGDQVEVEEGTNANVSLKMEVNTKLVAVLLEWLQFGEQVDK